MKCKAIVKNKGELCAGIGSLQKFVEICRINCVKHHKPRHKLCIYRIIHINLLFMSQVIPVKFVLNPEMFVYQINISKIPTLLIPIIFRSNSDEMTKILPVC